MLLLKYAIGKGVNPFLVELFDELLKVGDPLTPEKLFNLHPVLQKLPIVGLLQFSETFTFAGNLRHLVPVDSRIPKKTSQICFQLSIRSQFLITL